MKTTLTIDDRVMAKVRREAARRGCTMSEIVEGALRLALGPRRADADLPKLPCFHGGAELVDVANRDALYSEMEERRCSSPTGHT